MDAMVCDIKQHWRRRERTPLSAETGSLQPGLQMESLPLGGSLQRGSSFGEFASSNGGCSSTDNGGSQMDGRAAATTEQQGQPASTTFEAAFTFAVPQTAIVLSGNPVAKSLGMSPQVAVLIKDIGGCLMKDIGGRATHGEPRTMAQCAVDTVRLHTGVQLRTDSDSFFPRPELQEAALANVNVLLRAAPLAINQQLIPKHPPPRSKWHMFAVRSLLYQACIADSIRRI